MAVLHARDFGLDSLGSKHVVNLKGDDPYYLNKIERLFCALVDKDMADFNLKIIEDLQSYDQLEEAVVAYPSFADCTVVIVRGVEKRREIDKKKVSSLVANVPEWCYLVAINAELFSPADQLYMVDVSADRINAGDLNLEVKRLFDEYHGIEMSAVVKLINFCNREMGRIEKERDKLTCFAIGREVTVEDVELLVPQDSENRLYEYTTAVVEKRKNDAQRLLTRLLKQGETKFSIMSALIVQYRRFFYCACSRLMDEDLAKMLGVKTFFVTKLRSATRLHKMTEVRNTLNMLVDTEYRQRKGEITEDMAFEIMTNGLWVN